MRKRWTFEELREIALRYETKGKFKKGHRRAYYAATHRDDYDLIVEHMPKYLNRLGEDVPRTEWTPEIIRAAALKFNKRIDFANGNWLAYNAALRQDEAFMDSICSHMEPSLTEAYTYEELKTVANKCANKGEFRDKYPNEWKAASNRDDYSLIVAHMPDRVDQSGENNPHFRWTLEMLQIEADKHLRRSDFEYENPGAVQVARKRGIYEQICSKMKPSSGSSRAERELFAIIKAICPETKKIRDMKVNIPGKPYIHGFEIDILVGKLGIEFDGKHHHTYKYMRNDPHKKLWSNKDIRNYHNLKDSWFATKGIQILHIREEDWIDNKQDCIAKCLTFLDISISCLPKPTLATLSA